MKSAYELAMERLEQEAPSTSKPLTDEQKHQLAEVQKRYDVKVADRVIFLEKALKDAEAAHDAGEAEKIRKQIQGERTLLQESCEQEKDALRASFK